MLVLKVGILLPAPPLYWWFIYDEQKSPILWVRRSQETFRSWSEAMENGEAALAGMLEQADPALPKKANAPSPDGRRRGTW